MLGPAILRHDAGGHCKGGRITLRPIARQDNILVVHPCSEAIMSKRSTRRSVSVLPPTERQILHTAKSDAQADPLPAESSPQSPGLDVSDSVDRQIADLLDRIAEGLQHDEQMQFDRLTLARNYGQLVLELKWAVPHGKYMDMLKERFPRSSYDKCNRWRFISERDDEVEAAIQTHPDVLWGPTKMIRIRSPFNQSSGISICLMSSMHRGSHAASSCCSSV